jgi:hypothetical protein
LRVGFAGGTKITYCAIVLTPKEIWKG